MPVKWQEPEGYSLKRGIWWEAADELRARPGKWAIIGTSSRGMASNTASTIRTSTAVAFREGKWEAVAQPTGLYKDNIEQWAIFARYLGESNADKSSNAKQLRTGDEKRESNRLAAQRYRDRKKAEKS